MEYFSLAAAAAAVLELLWHSDRLLGYANTKHTPSALFFSDERSFHFLIQRKPTHTGIRLALDGISGRLHSYRIIHTTSYSTRFSQERLRFDFSSPHSFNKSINPDGPAERSTFESVQNIYKQQTESLGFFTPLGWLAVSKSEAKPTCVCGKNVQTRSFEWILLDRHFLLSTRCRRHTLFNTSSSAFHWVDVC